MINKTYLRGLKKFLISKNPQKKATLKNYLSAFFKISLSPRPLDLQVEPSAVCNLKCKMCSLDKSTNKKKFLTPKDLSIIIEKFNPNSINLTGMGETLLNPYFEQLLKICFIKKIKTSFITNIQLLNPKHLQAIKKYPPNSISISMESAYAKKYNSVRAGANLLTTVKKIKELMTFIADNSLNTQVYINIVFLDFNLKELKHVFKIIDLASKLKINKITSQNINKLSPYIKTLYITKKIVKIFKKIQDYSQIKQVRIDLPPTKISGGKCYYPWVYPQITATGEILPCCVIPQFGQYDYIVKKYSFGNILNSTLNKSWNSIKARNFRRNYQKDTFCRYCTKNQGVL
jgi:MoaA/NifB/PqqE/SkfB family radical SAM enzyme